jgi:hypothetical protein
MPVIDSAAPATTINSVPEHRLPYRKKQLAGAE